MKLGIEKTAMVRVRAGISYALTEAMDEGHCGLPTDELVPLAEKLLEVPDELVRTALDLELQEGCVDRLNPPGQTGHRATIANRSLMTHNVISLSTTAALRKAYSITSSAVASSLSGTARPSVFAVLRLITSSNLVGNCAGRSLGFSPLRMRLT
jgi:hypothetical protein